MFCLVNRKFESPIHQLLVPMETQTQYVGDTHTITHRISSFAQNATTLNHVLLLATNFDRTQQ